MAQQIIDSIFAVIPREVGVFLISLLPIIELRGAIPVGIGLGLEWWAVYLLSVVGNLLPVPLILLFVKALFDFLRDKPGIGRLVCWLEAHSLKKSDKITRYSAWGLFLFVAIPLPGTGAWTGALLASLLEMRFKYAFWSIFGGVLTAGVVMTLLSLGVFSLPQIFMG